MNKQEELLKRLFDSSLITEKQLAELKADLAVGAKALDELLVEKKLIDAEKLTEFKAGVYGLHYVNLANRKISDVILHSIPVEVSENYKILCFEKEGKKISVGVVDPDNFKAFEAIDFLAKERSLEASYFLISQASFNGVFRQYKSLNKEISAALKIKEEEDEKTQQQKEEVQFDEVIGGAPVVKIVSVIIRHAVEGGASDIHIEPLQKESRVRYRVDGVLRTSLVLPKNIHNALVGRIKVMANLKLDETRLPQDGRIRQVVDGKEVDFRVSILPLVGEEKVVMRILDVTKGAPTLEGLGYSGIALDIIKRNVLKTNKMFLVVGPTGSGKSTTLFSILYMLNRENVNISTLEDPVEYFLEGVNQAQVKPEIGFSFASGLRSLLRQDPNVIMVGEIRDNETAELAIHASLTGHFVLSTLHTNDALGAIPRLLDMEVEAFLLGSTLNTVVAQRLTRKICGFCKVEEEVPKDVMDDLQAELSLIEERVLKNELKDYDMSKLRLFKGKGCPRCGGSGYSGRVAISEVIDINNKIRELIIENSRPLRLEDLKANQDFITMKQDGYIKSLKGLTTIEEVLRVIRD